MSTLVVDTIKTVDGSKSVTTAALAALAAAGTGVVFPGSNQTKLLLRGDNTFTNALADFVKSVVAGAAGFQATDSTAGGNAKTWAMRSVAGVGSIDAVDDAGSTFNPALSITRTGAVPATMTLMPNGNPVAAGGNFTVTGALAAASAAFTAPIGLASGGSGQATRQAAINALTAVGAASNEYVLTKDTASGNAAWKINPVSALGTAAGLATSAVAQTANNLSDLASKSTSFTNLQFLSSATGAAARSARAKGMDIVSAKDFGAVGDGATDDYVRLQAWLNSGGGHLLLPYGTYRTTVPLTFTGSDRTVIEGCGSTISLDEATGLLDVLKIGNGSGGPYGVVVRNLLVTRAQVATAGAGITADRANGIKLQNVTAYGNSKLFRGLNFHRNIDSWVLNCQVEHCVDHGIYAEGTDATTNACNMHVFDTMSQYNGGDGIRLYDWTIGSSIFRNTLFSNGGLGLTIDASNGAHTGGDFEISQNNIDSNTLGGLYIDKYGNCRINDNWFSSNGAANLTTKQTVSNVMFTGNLCYSANPHFSLDIDGTGFIVSANYVYNGNTGIKLRGNAKQITIASNLIGYTTQYGIDLSLNPDTVVIAGNVYTNNGGANVNPGGTNIRALDQYLNGDAVGNVVMGAAALATNATAGFPYLPTCPGTPTGTPTSYTGRTPMVVDTAAAKVWVYTGGAWKYAALT